MDRLACFNGMENIFDSLLNQGAISGTGNHNTLPLHLQRLLEIKLCNIVNHLARSSGEIFSLACGALARKMLMEAELRFPKRKSQALLKHKRANTTTPY